MQRVPRPRSIPPTLLLLLTTALVLAGPRPTAGQVLERLGRAATHEAEAETRRQVRSAVRTAIRCAVHDRVCQDPARREGHDVILVDAQGNRIDRGARGQATWDLELGDEEWEGDAAPFVVRLDRVDESEVSGAYHGTVRCEDAGSSVRAIGTFRIAR